jgi:hypothetical protein
MRLASVILFVLALAALAVAAYAGGPLWRMGLYASVLLFSLTGTLASAALVEMASAEKARTSWAGLALVVEAAALGISRLGPLGSLPERPLIDLGRSGVSIAGLGLCVGGGVLAWLGARSRARVASVASGIALILGLIALGPWLARLS